MPQYTDYQSCYDVGQEDFYSTLGAGRPNITRCIDRNAYNDGWHDARRKKQEEDRAYNAMDREMRHRRYPKRPDGRYY